MAKKHNAPKPAPAASAPATKADPKAEKRILDEMRAAAVTNPDVHPARQRRQRQAAQDAALQGLASAYKAPSPRPAPPKPAPKAAPPVETPLAMPPSADAPPVETPPIEAAPVESLAAEAPSDTTILEAVQEPIVQDTPAAQHVEGAALSLVNITKTYGTGERAVDVLRGVDLSIASGQIVGLIGPSGSGKSTLLQVTGLLDNPTGGAIAIGGQAAETLNDKGRTRLRRTTVGFVYQFHHLLREFSALENVMIPQQLAGKDRGTAQARATQLLDAVGLSHRLHHRPAKLSGGEQQRVAIARALANRPALLLADEPTGNLDPQTAEMVFQMLLTLTRQEGMAALIATHNLELGARMDRVVSLDHGVLYEGAQQ